MSGKYQHREGAVNVACPMPINQSSYKRKVRSLQPVATSKDIIYCLTAAMASVLAFALLLAAAPAEAEGRPQQMEFSRAPAPVAEQNAELSGSREADHCANCCSQAKILLAWDYPAVDEFLVFYASSPNADFTQLSLTKPVIRAPNGEYEIEIDAGLELGAAIGEQVCFRVQAASVTGDFVCADDDSVASAVMCSELQS